MYTYRVYTGGTYHVIEAEYFYVTKDEIGNRDACFCVRKPVDVPGGKAHEEVLVGWAKNPSFIQFDDTYVAQPNPGRNLDTINFLS